MELTGKIASDQIFPLRFSGSGKLAVVNFQINQIVSRSKLLAQQDQTELQKYLDRALKQYDQTRAEFEEKQKTKLDEYNKIKIQANLDISVKNVEIAKANLEATNLYSPVNGMIIDADPAVPGINITPASLTVTILKADSLYFQAEADEKQIANIFPDLEAKIKLKAYPERQILGKITKVGFLPDKAGNYPIAISLEDQANLRLGLTGTATLG